MLILIRKSRYEPTRSALDTSGHRFRHYCRRGTRQAFLPGHAGAHAYERSAPFALVFNANGVMVRLQMAKKLPEAYGTVLGWQVPEISRVMQNLKAVGIQFERFDGLVQDESGVWSSPTGAKIAWFRDPDGNVLSVSEHPACEIPTPKAAGF